MSKLGNYISAIKQQTDILREILSKKSGIDCSKMSLSDCSGIIHNNITIDTTPKYSRPNWYPDIIAIAKEIKDTKVDTYYRPACIILLDNTKATTKFSISYNSPYPDIYFAHNSRTYIICSDEITDIHNITTDMVHPINSTTKVYEHTWDTAKDYKDPHSDKAVRFAILYEGYQYSGSSPSFGVCDYTCPLLEFVGIHCTFQKFLGDSSTSRCMTLKYIHLIEDCKIPAQTTQYYGTIPIIKFVTEQPQVLLNYNTVEFEYPLDKGTVRICGGDIRVKHFTINTYYTFTENTWLYTNILDLTNCTTTDFSRVYLYGYDRTQCGPTKIIFNPNSTQIIGFNCKTYSDVEIPETCTVLTNTKFPYSSYVKLYNDFNISGCDFTGNVNKRFEWLRNLCIWLKDRTGEEAGTMIIGENNINNANNIYLTFNPNDKRDITFDGVTSETEGAISITEFITNQLNWTLS